MTKRDPGNTISILFTGGGSGGHTMPALAMIESLENYSSGNIAGFTINYIGSKKGIERGVIENKNIPYYPISTGKLRRYFSLHNFFDLFRITAGFFQSFFLLLKLKPRIVFSTGGFVSVPPVIAAWVLRKKIIIHEQTIDAGLANKIASRFARKVALTFKESSRFFPASKTALTGIPLRNDIFAGNKERFFLEHNLDTAKPTLYFSGGGLGCHVLNLAALEIVPVLLEQYNVIFQTGNAAGGEDFRLFQELKNGLEKEKKGRLLIYNFIEGQMGDIYASADLVIARSGAGTVCELIAQGLPAIFIPLAIATGNEQFKNASLVQRMGGAVILEEKNLSPDTLQKTIMDIMDGDKLNMMRSGLKKVHNFRGNSTLVELILETVG